MRELRFQDAKGLFLMTNMKILKYRRSLGMGMIPLRALHISGLRNITRSMENPQHNENKAFIY